MLDRVDGDGMMQSGSLVPQVHSLPGARLPVCIWPRRGIQAVMTPLGAFEIGRAANQSA